MPIELHLQANTHAELCDKALYHLGITPLDSEGRPTRFAPPSPQETVSLAQAWTLGPNGETMFLGQRFDTELAEKFKIIGREVFMLGKDGLWRRAAAKTWVKLDPNVEPGANV